MELIKETVLCLSLAGIAGGLVTLIAPKKTGGIIRAALLAFVISAAAVPYLREKGLEAKDWKITTPENQAAVEELSELANEQWKAETQRLIAGQVKAVLGEAGAENASVTVRAEMGKDGVVYASEIYILLDKKCAVDPSAVSRAVKARLGVEPTVTVN